MPKIPTPGWRFHSLTQPSGALDDWAGDSPAPRCLLIATPGGQLRYIEMSREELWKLIEAGLQLLRVETP